jgi:hypothetical protein
VSGVAACASVLGLDAPDLDPCAHGGCVDGAASPDAPLSGDAGAADAPPEGAAVPGIRCGGGDYPQITCVGQTPLCCQVPDDAGAPTYVCRASGACEGFPISCSSNNDCSGSNVCCHSSTSIKCVKQTSCADNALVCEPDGAVDQCPTGWSCKAAIVNDDAAAPYFGCAP